jgi:hypothetical protein
MNEMNNITESGRVNAVLFTTITGARAEIQIILKIVLFMVYVKAIIYLNVGDVV